MVSLVAAARAASAAASVGVTDATEKVRPNFAVPAQTTASLDAARN